jgi:hypothetical protein
MATLTTKHSRHDWVYFKYDGKIHAGEVIAISAKQGVFTDVWTVEYDLQTGMDSGVNRIPEEHLFATREEAEADKDWESRCVIFCGY